MNFDLPLLRIGLYAALCLFSFLLFCLCCARLNYTNHLPKGDTLNGGHDFYDPVIVELLITTLMAMPWCIFMILCIHKRLENRYISTFRGELIGLGIIWLFWIIGSAIASDNWGNLSWCQGYSACRLLSALVAFCWLGWITLTLILGVSLLFAIANKAFLEPLHGRWDPRVSVYGKSSA